MTFKDESHELHEAFGRLVAVALTEDLGEIEIERDITTRTIVPDDLHGTATVYAKQRGVLCGTDALRATYSQLDPDVTVSLARKDGDDVDEGEAVSTIEGAVVPILVGERTALNLMGHLSGIATKVRAFVREAPGITLTDTRKTLPGLRLVQKYAVRVGGGSNHRFALWDGVLIKDNHIVAAVGVGEAVKRARTQTALPVQAECTSKEEVDEALDAGAHAILLDNRTPDELSELASYIHSRAEHVMVEASGGVTIDNIGEVAKTGVDRISIGAFTHSAPALDLSMKLEKTWRAE